MHKIVKTKAKLNIIILLVEAIFLRDKGIINTNTQINIMKKKNTNNESFRDSVSWLVIMY